MVKKEYNELDFLEFLEANAKVATERLDLDEVIDKFRDDCCDTGHCSLTDDDLKRSFQRFRSHFCAVLTRSASDTLQLYFALKEPISKEFVKEMEKDYDIELDDDRCIIRFQQKEKENVVVAAPPPEEPEKPQTQAPVVKNNVTTLEDFLKEKCENATSVYTLSHLLIEYEEKSKTGMDYKTFWSKIRDHRRGVPERNDMDINTKVRHLFALHGKINPDFLKELRQNAHVDVNKSGLITNYVSNDGCLTLEKKKKQMVIRGKNKRTRSNMMSKKNSEKDAVDEDEEDVIMKKRLKRGPRIPPQPSFTSDRSRRHARRQNTTHSFRGYSRENSPPSSPAKRRTTVTKKKLRRRCPVVTMKEEEEDMDVGDVGFNDVQNEMDDTIDMNSQNSQNDEIEEENMEDKPSTSSQMRVRRSERMPRYRESSIYFYPYSQKNHVRKAHRARKLPPLRLSSIRSTVSNAPVDDYFERMFGGLFQDQAPPPSSPNPLEKEDPPTRNCSRMSQFSIAQILASIANSGPIEYPEATEDPESMEDPEAMNHPESTENLDSMENQESTEDPVFMKMPESMEDPESMMNPESTEDPIFMKIPESMMEDFESMNNPEPIEMRPIAAEETSGHTERRIPFRSFSERDSRYTTLIQELLNNPSVIQQAPPIPEAPPTLVSTETNTETTSPTVKEEVTPEDEVVFLRSVKSEPKDDGFRVPELPPTSEVVSVDKHKMFLECIQGLIRTLELSMSPNIQQNIDKTIKEMRDYGRRKEDVTTEEILGAANYCLMIIKKTAKSSTTSQESSSEKSYINLGYFLVLLRNAILSMDFPFFSKFLQTLKRRTQESQNEEIAMDKVQLALEAIINIVAPAP
ncbi:hypothetical protein CAEBREN_17637 [Caenorhabditis brenneri]|uniref:SPK domain-containing protein n=1 Tax=Caenorhabditis brenneri TaxID=135651 RepID=G0P3E7_CAEBE|nr:hypothetical protein CAEBREN_17637 [Caenorhabditis brenneri]